MALATIWYNLLTSFVLVSNLYHILDISWHYQTYAVEQMEQARTHRGELMRLTKALQEAKNDLENVNIQLRYARQAAEEARRLKVQFAANVSHELRTPINLIVGFSEMIATAPMAALYSLMKGLSLLNSRVGLILIYSAGAIPFGVLIYSSFIKNVPMELDEAATIDGCGYFQRFFLIIFPLLKPAVITHIVFSASFIWNDFFMPFLFITSEDKKTLPPAIYSFQSNNVTDYGPIFAMLVMAVLPLVIFFLFSQRYFYDSVAGSVKG